MDTQNHVDQLFLNTKPVNILIELQKHGGNYALALASDADVTYAHTVKCLQRMHEIGIVDFERKGRRKEVLLTDYGKKISEEFSELVDLFNNSEQDGKEIN